MQRLFAECRLPLEAGSCAPAAMTAFVFLFAFAGTAMAANPRKLNVGGEVQCGVSSLERSPEPVQADTGLKPIQEYRLTADGGMFKQGSLESEAGFRIDDRYGGDTGSFEDKVRFDYGPWVRFDTSTRRETDQEIFFLGTNEPQSPIHMVTKKTGGVLSPNRQTSVEYRQETRERKDLFLGSVVNEETKSQTAKMKVQTNVWDINGGYQVSDFDDLLGMRGDIDSEDLDLDLRFKPRKAIFISGAYRDDKDEDVDNRTELKTRDARVHGMVKLHPMLKLQGRLRGREDGDTRTQEEIDRNSAEAIVNFDPLRQLGLEGMVKREDEDKNRTAAADGLTNVDSARNEGRAQIRFIPIAPIMVRGGYEVSDKGSSLASENLMDNRIFSDLTLNLLNNLRLGGTFLNLKSKNTKDSSFQSDTDTVSFTLQHLPLSWISTIARLDLGGTDNPETGAFTETDTLSANISIRPSSVVTFSWRASGQAIEGSAQNAASERLLNAVRSEVKVTRSLRLSAEYELINSRGTANSNENLIDLALFYLLNRFDFSLRIQIRQIAGDNATTRGAVLGNLKYRLRKNAVFSIRLSYSDYEDEALLSNTYNAFSLESLLSLTF